MNFFEFCGETFKWTVIFLLVFALGPAILALGMCAILILGPFALLFPGKFRESNSNYRS